MSNQFLNEDELVGELKRSPGLIPVEIDPIKQRLVWADLGRLHLYEGFFHRSLNLFLALKQAGNRQDSIKFFISDVAVLHSERILTDFIYPTGFIFHAGRCGSTLLTKTLAKSRANLVFGEAAPHNQIWSVFSDNWQTVVSATQDNQRRYKHLLLAMGRKRLATHTTHFIKFTSFNILLFSFIRAAFPDVPAIFLYRRPSDILASFRQTPPGWLKAQADAMQVFLSEERIQEPELYAEKVLARFFSAALEAGTKGLKYLHYHSLSAQNLPAILNVFGIAPPSNQLALIQTQFGYNAKTDYYQQKFSFSKQVRASTFTTDVSYELQELYMQLLQSDLNIIQQTVERRGDGA